MLKTNKIEITQLSRRTFLRSLQIGAAIVVAKPMLSFSSDALPDQNNSLGFLAYEFEPTITTLNSSSELLSDLGVFDDGANINLSAHLGNDLEEFESVSVEIYLLLDGHAPGLRQLLWSYSNKGIESQSAPVSFFAPLPEQTLKLQQVSRIAYKDQRLDYTQSRNIILAARPLLEGEQLSLYSMKEGSYFIPLLPDRAINWPNYTASSEEHREALVLTPLTADPEVSPSYLQLKISPYSEVTLQEVGSTTKVLQEKIDG